MRSNNEILFLKNIIPWFKKYGIVDEYVNVVDSDSKHIYKPITAHNSQFRVYLAPGNWTTLNPKVQQVVYVMTVGEKGIYKRMQWISPSLICFKFYFSVDKTPKQESTGH